ncbi:MAG: 3-phosphoshikimate 1-carboxyvinyltransferase, partial [Okeania sp. SIO2D1]|nr:3-phosphoshikimate 1-carboxyvinyltransferase [Okeania sp. SIO2D1]
MAVDPFTLKTSAQRQDLIITPPSGGFALRGKISLPGDKSISHRALMLGSLAQGETKIQGLLLGEDPRSSASCFRAMGAEISE